jgi:hypothetical protein
MILGIRPFIRVSAFGLLSDFGFRHSGFLFVPQIESLQCGRLQVCAACGTPAPKGRHSKAQGKTLGFTIHNSN